MVVKNKSLDTALGVSLGDVKEMTIKDFLSLPHRDWEQEIDCESIIILPTKEIHDSGYRAIEVVAVAKNEPICLCAGGSDVIHIDGIGGFGHNWSSKYVGVPKQIPPSGWSIDCLPKSGLFRMWPSSGKIKITSGLSSLEVFAMPSKKDK